MNASGWKRFCQDSAGSIEIEFYISLAATSTPTIHPSHINPNEISKVKISSATQKMSSNSTTAAAAGDLMKPSGRRPFTIKICRATSIERLSPAASWSLIRCAWFCSSLYALTGH